MEVVDPELLSTWKSKYGSIFAIDDYIFRALTVEEYKELTRHKEWTTVEAEDFIVKTALLQPSKTNWPELESSAGLITSLAEEVLNISGYGDVQYAKSVMDDARKEAAQVLNLMKVFIIAAIPGYTDLDLDKFTFSELALKVALAEQIIGIRKGIEVREGETVLELIDPEEEKSKENQKIKKELSTKKPGQATSADPIAQRLRSALG